VNKPSDPSTKKLSELLEIFYLHHHITEAIHENDAPLDLVITSKKYAMIICEVDEMNSDHNNVNTKKRKTNRKTVASRQYKNINIIVLKKYS
jgi:hypothetical protein